MLNLPMLGSQLPIVCKFSLSVFDIPIFILLTYGLFMLIALITADVIPIYKQNGLLLFTWPFLVGLQPRLSILSLLLVYIWDIRFSYVQLLFFIDFFFWTLASLNMTDWIYLWILHKIPFWFLPLLSNIKQLFIPVIRQTASALPVSAWDDVVSCRVIVIETYSRDEIRLKSCLSWTNS